MEGWDLEMAKQKYTEEFVKNFLNELGCELLSEYSGVKENFEYRCSCGEKSTSNFDKFINAGQKGCNKCSGKRSNESNKLTFDYVKEYFEEQGCKLLESEYINSKTPMNYICSCGEHDVKIWNKFKNGQRCKKCGEKKRVESQKIPLQEVKEFFNSCNYELLEDEYVSIHTEMKCICSCGKEIKKSLSTLKASPKCTCNSKNISNGKLIKVKFTEDDLIEYFWKYVDEFKKYPTTKEFNKNKNYPSISCYDRKWGSFKRFQQDIGVITEHGWYTEDENVLIDNYKFGDIERINDLLIVKRSESTIRHHAQKLGLYVEYEYKYGIKKYSKEEIIDSIIKFNEENAKIPTLSELIEYKGILFSQIRQEFGTWNNAIKNAGFEPFYINKNFNSDDVELLIEMYKSGISIIDIANHFGFKDGASIFYYLNRDEVEFRNNIWNSEEIEYLKENYSTESLENIQNALSKFSLEDIFQKSSKLGLKRSLGNLGNVKKYTASDGTICLSFSEYRICELLIKNNIKYEKELFYKDILNDENMGKLRCDWMIGDIVIEYFGISSSEKYRNKVSRKKLACKKANQKLISLYFYDLMYDYKGLLNKFSEYGIELVV